ncbi:MAG TPA: protein-L-isoaspartate(D-aspartate) O-methyltransferase [Phycisphaerae bacterium]|nr:protein-L-isoaspartate(D-aspartate) O-methyltransferase [Phycisphaerae bacterium]HRY70218.1 protein-L-isoaspartate(D-aspartate) O-methyltransferase [Phycisphaerae bacterium]
MVDSQLRQPVDGREAIRDERVLQAMRIVPRHLFIPESMRRSAYHDGPLPIGHEQTISQPYIVALMTEAIGLRSGERVLEVGTGSGYQAAVLAHLTSGVYTIEIVEPLAERARRTLLEQGYEEVRCRAGDGYKGWPEAAPFDAIMITCAAPEVPAPLWQQLKAGGRLVMPLGEAGHVQQLILLTKRADGGRHEQRIIPVSFVPMTRERGAR